MDRPDHYAGPEPLRTTPDPAVGLVGRDADRQTLDELVGRVRDGLSAALVLVGDAGIGKTRLLAHVAESATDLQLVRAAGVPSEAALGFAALHRLLLPFLGRIDRLPPHQRDALHGAFGLVEAPPSDRFLIGIATLALLTDAAAEASVLCLVDDAHWIDEDSAAVLGFVARRLHADGVGMLFAVREREATPALDGLPLHSVGRLAEPDARRLLDTHAPGTMDEVVASRVVTECDGNPLALIELVGRLSPEQLAGRATLPVRLPVGRRLEQHYLAQVDALPGATRLLLLTAAASVFDDPAVVRRAATLLDLPADAADQAVAQRILAGDGDWTFRHPLIRSAVYDGATPAERRRVHRALADATDAVHDPDRRAWHRAWAAAGTDAEVAAELERAAERARARSGYSAEATLLLRAAELTPDRQEQMRRLVGCAEATSVGADMLRARELLDTALPQITDPVLRLRALQLWAAVQISLSAPAEVPAALLGAPDLAAADRPLSRDILLVALDAALTAQWHTAGVTLSDVARAALATPPQPGQPSRPADLLLDAFATRLAVGYRDAVPLLRAAVTALLTSDPGADATRGRLLVIMLSSELWDDADCVAMLDRMVAHYRRRQALGPLLFSLYGLVTWQARTGRLDLAAETCAEVVEIGVVQGTPQGGPAVEFTLLAWQGPADTARATGEQLLGLARTHRAAGLELHVLEHLVLVELGTGRFAEALAAARRVFDRDSPGYSNQVLADLVEAGARSGDRAAAEAALERLTERATASGTHWALGQLARSRALLAHDDAEPLYRSAVAHLRRSPVRTELARAHLLHGEWLLGPGGRVDDARHELRTAHALFDAMGAQLFAERAATGLRTTGQHVRSRGADQTVPDLTEQEARVARLAAEGASNLEIAARLFVSTSTVEFHLTKVYRKLGITSRRRLGAALSPAAVPDR